MRGTLLLLVVVALGSSCSMEQDGLLVFHGMELDRCEVSDPEEIGLDFVWFDDCDGIVFLRMQHHGKAVASSDGVSLQIADPAAMREQLKAGPLVVTLPDDGYRMMPYVNRTCPDSFTNWVVGKGTLTIDALEIMHEGEIDLAAEFELVNDRTGEIVADRVEVTMSGRLTDRAPHKTFSICTD